MTLTQQEADSLLQKHNEFVEPELLEFTLPSVYLAKKAPEGVRHTRSRNQRGHFISTPADPLAPLATSPCGEN